MTSRERVLCALNRGTPDRVPYCEVAIDEPIACRLLGEEPPEGRYYEAGEYVQHHAEREKAVSRALGRDNICYNFRPPIPAETVPGKDNILFYADGRIRSESDLDQLRLPDPFDDRMYEDAKAFLTVSGWSPDWPFLRAVPPRRQATSRQDEP